MAFHALSLSDLCNWYEKKKKKRNFYWFLFLNPKGPVPLPHFKVIYALCSSIGQQEMNVYGTA